MKKNSLSYSLTFEASPPAGNKEVDSKQEQKRYPVLHPLMCDCNICSLFSKIRNRCSAQKEHAGLSMLPKTRSLHAWDTSGLIWHEKLWGYIHIWNSSESVAYVDICKSGITNVQNCFYIFFFLIYLSLLWLKKKLAVSYIRSAICFLLHIGTAFCFVLF